MSSLLLVSSSSPSARRLPHLRPISFALSGTPITFAIADSALKCYLRLSLPPAACGMSESFPKTANHFASFASASCSRRLAFSILRLADSVVALAEGAQAEFFDGSGSVVCWDLDELDALRSARLSWQRLV